jgi:hypothetical protein
MGSLVFDKELWVSIRTQLFDSETQSENLRISVSSSDNKRAAIMFTSMALNCTQATSMLLGEVVA